MRVFNLTDQRVDYRGKLIPPYGSEEYDLSFIPDRDKMLEKRGMLAFGALPKFWKKPEPPKPAPAKPVKVEVKAQVEVKKELPEEEVKAVEAPKVEERVEMSFKKKRF